MSGVGWKPDRSPESGAGPEGAAAAGTATGAGTGPGGDRARPAGPQGEAGQPGARVAGAGPAGGPRRHGPVVVAGDLVLDLVVRVPETLHRGSDTWGALHPRQGGSAANTAAWLARLGLEVVFAGRVGRDPLGRALASSLAAEGVVVRVVEDPQLPTGVILALVEPDGERSMVIGPGANHRLDPADLPEGLIEEAGFLYLTAYSFVWPQAREGAGAALARARRAGVPVAVDASSAALLAREGPAELAGRWQGVHCLFANEEEARVLAGVAGPEAAARLGRFVPVVGVKAGARGAYGRAWGRPWQVDALPLAQVVDTTGCGDAWNAGMLAGLQAGLPAEAAARLGGFVAAWVAARPGAVPPGWTEADRRAAWAYAWDAAQGLAGRGSPAGDGGLRPAGDAGGKGAGGSQGSR